MEKPGTELTMLNCEFIREGDGMCKMLRRSETPDQTTRKTIPEQSNMRRTAGFNTSGIYECMSTFADG